jgi:2-polyprenyl-3-methyl-5-hydroxy-6-metoxy-1,4-benzoquinol methylase
MTETKDMTAAADQPTDRTVDDAETAKFAAMAEEWWDPDGKFRPLHKFNPVRLEFLRDRICATASARASSATRWARGRSKG